jgi:hypothetical protein
MRTMTRWRRRRSRPIVWCEDSQSNSDTNNVYNNPTATQTMCTTIQQRHKQCVQQSNSDTNNVYNNPTATTIYPSRPISSHLFLNDCRFVLTHSLFCRSRNIPWGRSGSAMRLRVRMGLSARINALPKRSLPNSKQKLPCSNGPWRR